MRQNIFKDIKTIPSTAINSLRNCMKDISGVTLIKKQKLFHIKSKSIHKCDLNQNIEKEVKVWETISALAERPKIIPKYFGAYLEDCSDEENYNLYLIFEEFPKTFHDILVSRSQLDNPNSFRYFYYLYEQLFGSLVALKKLEICPYFITPNHLFFNEETHEIHLYHIDYTKNYFSKILEESSDLTKEEWFYLAPEIKQSQNDIDPYKNCVFSIALVLLGWNFHKEKINYENNLINIEELIAEFENKFEEYIKNRPSYKKCISCLKRCLHQNPKERPDPLEIFLDENENENNEENLQKLKKTVYLEKNLSNFENLNTFVSPEKNYLLKFNQILGIKANASLNKLISKVTPIRNLTIDRVYDNKFLMFEFEYLINSANFPQSCFDSFCKIRNFLF